MNADTARWGGYAATIVMVIAVILIMMSTPDEYMMMQIIMLVVMVPLLALGIGMAITGKGSSLIAGFNTSPKGVREMYDKDALSRFFGLGVFLMCLILLFAMEAFILSWGTVLGVTLIAVFIIFMAWFLWYPNSKDRFKLDPGAPMPVPTETERKRNTKVVLAAVGTSAVIVLAVIFALFSYGNVTADLDDDLTVKAPMVNESIEYDDITAYEIRDDLTTGKRISGFGTPKIKSGLFSNSEFGNYTLASYADVHTHIVIHTASKTVVFNLDSVEKTNKIFQDLEVIMESL